MKSEKMAVVMGLLVAGNLLISQNAWPQTDSPTAAAKTSSYQEPRTGR